MISYVRGKRGPQWRYKAALSIALWASFSAHAQTEIDWNLIDKYCSECHNLDDYAGNVAFDLLSPNELLHDAATWELVIRKVRTGMMPPAGKPRPPRESLDSFVAAVGNALDEQYAKHTVPAAVGLARLNREEYRNAIRDLLQFDASHIVANLPAETAGAGFDNNIALLSISPTLVEAYADAAMRIGREAVGDLSLVASEVVYAPGSPRQIERVEALPLGTRGGFAVRHNFPVDATYRLSINTRGGPGFFGGGCAGGNRVVLSIDGELIEVEDPRMIELPISAGSHDIAAALQDLRLCAGAIELFDDFSLDGAVAGITINGPFDITGPGDTPSRRAIFSCHPQNSEQADSCARQILSRLASRAYRKALTPDSEEINELMAFHTQGSALGGFEAGVQYALSRMLMDPRFLFQVEEVPDGVAQGEAFVVGDLELASRLSFFLWSTIPDEELFDLALAGHLSRPEVLEAQVKRMLRDAKTEALVRNFAGQWLMLRELDSVQPQDAAFTPGLLSAFRSETQLLFADLINDDRGLLALLDSDYTWLNEELARHYGIEGVSGSHMRKVPLQEDSPRRGLLGQGSILTATSVANRTSPVVRGAWIVEHLLGAPVPTPPPGVETDLSAEPTNAAEPETLRDRLEMHRANPSCASCHQIMDPIGLALENFDLVGRWRTQENGHPLNTRTELMDGTVIDGAVTLRRALLDRGDAVASTIIEKLLSYALGRDLQPQDMAAVRKIQATTKDAGYRFSDVILAIVDSMPFRMSSPEVPAQPLAQQ